MKYLIAVVILVSMTNTINSQSYSIHYDNGTQIRWIHITIDTSYTSNTIFVEKVFATSSVDTVLDQNDLVLLGNFSISSSTSPLDFGRYNYFWIPFDPAEPFFNFESTAGLTTETGTLFIGGTGSSSIGPEDIVYWCACGGMTADSEGPGGCLSAVQGGKIRCIRDGSDCQSACIGDFGTYWPLLIPGGGGILIQVGAGKFRMAHNFGTY
ncbi:MAG TPA: hypothetical protein VFG10_02645 [Saprospiraceae bacterium]|nr:hypothetical protein [Saprospiraceae bacterium]